MQRGARRIEALVADCVEGPDPERVVVAAGQDALDLFRVHGRKRDRRPGPGIGRLLELIAGDPDWSSTADHVTVTRTLDGTLNTMGR